MALSFYKLISSLAIGILILVCGLIPLKSVHFRSSPQNISLGNCFSGGLFLALAILHLLPEARMELESTEDTESSNRSSFPITFAICLAAFSFILLIDRVMFKSNEARNHDRPVHIEMNETFPNNFGQPKDKQAISIILESENEGDMEPITAKSKKPHSNTIDDVKHAEVQKIKVTSLPTNKKLRNMTSLEEKLVQNKLNKLPTIPDSIPENKTSGTSLGLIGQSRGAETISNLETFGPPTSWLENHPKYQKNVFKGAMLVMIMGIHGFFNGIALGVSDSYSQLTTMLIATVIHKFPEAITVGASLVSSKLSQSTATKFIYLLAVFTPAGIIIGNFISQLGTVASGVCKAISAGAILYISTMEIIVEEFSRENSTTRKFLVFCLGIGVVVGLELFE